MKVLGLPINGNQRISGVYSFVGAYDGDENIILPYHYLISKNNCINVVDRKKSFTVYDGGVSGKNAIFKKYKVTENVGIFLELKEELNDTRRTM